MESKCECKACKINNLIRQGGLHLVLWEMHTELEERHKYPIVHGEWFYKGNLESLVESISPKDIRRWERANTRLVNANSYPYQEDKDYEIELAFKQREKVDSLKLMLLDNFNIDKNNPPDLKLGDNPVECGGVAVLTINGKKPSFRFRRGF